MLTDSSGAQFFGFCRRVPPSVDDESRSPRCLTLITRFAWFSVFPHLLVRFEKLFQAQGLSSVASIIDMLNLKSFNRERHNITHVIQIGNDLVELKSPRPSDNLLDDVPCEELFRSLYASNVVAFLAALLSERRILVISKDYSRLSSAVRKVFFVFCFFFFFLLNTFFFFSMKLASSGFRCCDFASSV